MPWQLNGHYYSFTEASIRANVPPVSGVYGLYNIRYQIWIGESANIRAELLRHQKEPRFGFAPYRPTGFTFELQPPESRPQRAQELIREYRPVRQSAFTFARPWKPARDPAMNALKSAATRENRAANHEEPPVKRQESIPRSSFGRYQLLAVATGFALAIVTAVFFGHSIATKREQPMRVENQQAPATASVEPLAGEPPSLSKEPLQQGPLTQSDKAEPTETKKADALPQDATRARSALQREHEKPGSLLAADKDPRDSRRPQPEANSRRWTVQVTSSPDRATAGVWRERLTNKGYEAFIVESEINGRIWYRVRVGSFATGQEAESARQTLEANEGFSDAFVVAGNANNAAVSRSR
jgi:cell division protein FtsN